MKQDIRVCEITPEKLHDLVGERDAVLICDGSSLVRNKVQTLASKADLPERTLGMIAGRGEETKSLECAQRVYHELAKARFGRDCMVIGIGGGAVTDFSGFIASTWMRGVELVLIPTTLLAQVDAAIGGKTAVNFNGVKNLIGTFYPASKVLLDTSFLTTLPFRVLNEGVFEMVKLSLVSGDSNMQSVMLDIPHTPNKWSKHDRDTLVWMYSQAKLAMIQDDVLDDPKSNRRMVLNFGHTAAHALEMHLHLSHGEAVALGMCAAARLSVKYAGLSVEEETTIRFLVRKFDGLTNITVSPDTVDRMAETVLQDKKVNHGDTVNLVLLQSIGNPVVKSFDSSVAKELLRAVCISPNQ